MFNFFLVSKVRIIWLVGNRVRCEHWTIMLNSGVTEPGLIHMPYLDVVLEVYWLWLWIVCKPLSFDYCMFVICTLFWLMNLNKSDINTLPVSAQWACHKFRHIMWLTIQLMGAKQPLLKNPRLDRATKLIGVTKDWSLKVVTSIIYCILLEGIFRF